MLYAERKMVMDHLSLDELRKQFGAVAATIAEGLSAENPHVVALVAKWDSADLVPGLSDMDFRVVCDDRTTVEDWVEIDRIAGRLHLEMVRANPQWNRINEHTAGLALTVSEALDGDGGNPERALWSLWWGSEEWFHRLKAEGMARDFNATDERYHLSKFLSYYSPYIHGIDPPINLGRFEPKYPLHSRCWHYFAPPVLSAAAILARKNFAGKRAGLSWLRDNGYVVEQVEAVFQQLDAHYETPEQTDAARLRAFEDLLFAGFKELYPLVVESVEYLDIDRSLQPAELRQQLASLAGDPLAALTEGVRYARIRAGRYYFLANAPDHFDARRLIYYELPWIKKLADPVFASLGTLQGDQTLSPEQCFRQLGLSTNKTEQQAINRVRDLARRTREDEAVPGLFQQAIEWFPDYYGLIERCGPVFWNECRRPGTWAAAKRRSTIGSVGVPNSPIGRYRESHQSRSPNR